MRTASATLTLFSCLLGLEHEHSFLFEKEVHRHDASAVEGRTGTGSGWHVNKGEQEAIAQLILQLSPEDEYDRADLTFLWHPADTKDTYYRDIQFANVEGPREGLLDHLLYQHGLLFVLLTRGLGVDPEGSALGEYVEQLKETYPNTDEMPVHQYGLMVFEKALKAREGAWAAVGNTKLTITALRHLHAFDHLFDKGKVVDGVVGVQASHSVRALNFIQRFDFCKKSTNQLIKQDYEAFFLAFRSGISEKLSDEQKKYWKIFKHEWLLPQTVDSLINIPELEIVQHTEGQTVGTLHLTADCKFIEGTFIFVGGTDHPILERTMHVPVPDDKAVELQTPSRDLPPRVKMYEYVMKWADTYFKLARQVLEGNDWKVRADALNDYRKMALSIQDRQLDPEPPVVIVGTVDDDGGNNDEH
mmetsp:Transcript_35672/g.81810  ORF Transcript_35672/g.81810 Transcript_35672/m.81810 type:complete len:416 (+) Transcript_35672:55-1302(+)